MISVYNILKFDNNRIILVLVGGFNRASD